MMKTLSKYSEHKLLEQEGVTFYYDKHAIDRFLKYAREKILPALKPGQPIIVDNASYHTTVTSDTRSPTTCWKKEEILNWLRRRGMHSIFIYLLVCVFVYVL